MVGLFVIGAVAKKRYPAAVESAFVPVNEFGSETAAELSVTEPLNPETPATEPTATVPTETVTTVPTDAAAAEPEQLPSEETKSESEQNETGENPA
jgi:hypothetical protein